MGSFPVFQDLKVGRRHEVVAPIWQIFNLSQVFLIGDHSLLRGGDTPVEHDLGERFLLGFVHASVSVAGLRAHNL